jgi:Peptidase family S41/N-terminal domain of Peptidase_S41 in eukaryotic IRBP
VRYGAERVIGSVMGVAVHRDWFGEIQAMCDYVQRFYFDPRIAEEVNARLRERLTSGAYNGVSDALAFAEVVSQDTIAVSGDQHLRLRHSVASLPERADPVVPESGRTPEEAGSEGHGFASVGRLAGNVGLVDIRRFFPLSMSRHAAAAAMHVIADTDALIVDLRLSEGGEPEMVAFMCSYLVDEPTHLNDLYFPAEDRTIEWWTDPDVPGPTFGSTKPVWVLISSATISAAEEFAYDLQQLQRAVLVGETTAGAANFDYRYRVTEHLMFSVPSGYPINPVSQQNWEGTGVLPDIETTAAAAFDTAYRLALHHVIGLGGDGHRRLILDEAVEGLKSRT